jgi:hypothetical protein
MKIIPTHSNRPMLTFKVGSTACKALGDLATAIQKAGGKQIEVSARKGSFRGVTEYAVTIVKAINGTAVDLRDNFKPEPVSAGPAASSSLIDDIQQLMHESATLTETELKQIAEAIAEPKAELAFFSQFRRADERQILHGHGFTVEELENGIDPETKVESIPEPIAPETKAEPVTETIIAPQPEPVMESKPLKESLVQYWMDIIDDTPFRYPEEKLRQLSLESGEEGEAARRIIARCAAIENDRAA